ITSVTFTCQELGTQLVKLWSIDKAGNADFCETYVIVQDNMGNCPSAPGQAKVAGQLKTEMANGVQNVAVQVSGSGNGVSNYNYTTNTDANGAYSFNAIPLSSNATVTPHKDDNPLNGVSTYDLVLISKHILGIESLNSPYKMIAADANKSGSITTFDIVELRKLILGVYNELPNNTSWRFVDKAFTFQNANNPFAAAFPESKALSAITGSTLDQDFVSIKVGDVNNNAIANSAMSSDDRSAGTTFFDVNDRAVAAGEEFVVDFKAAEKMAAYQFTMNFAGLEVVEVIPGENMGTDNFGVFADAITASFEGNAQAFAVKFRAKNAGQLSNMLAVSSRITKAEAYNVENGARNDVAFRFNGTTGIVAGSGFELFQNTPNPVEGRTNISFNLPSASEATLTITTIDGRIVKVINGNYAKGLNTVTINRSDLSSGVLFYQLSAGSNNATKKMVVVE
ncbi:MAG: T9SS type A sorting domain-containing protein, partial [Bacteroidetes bacterium]|nr:T9SS type A sorting domain-containing protein [Bacteroidota bacterium]